MSSHSAIPVLLLWLTVSVQTWAQKTERELRANPFSRPAYTVDLEVAPSLAPFPARIELELRATMTSVSGDAALANINGQILTTGQEYNGYRVLEISEGRAVLRRDGERLVLNIYEKQQGIDQNSD